MGLIQIHSDADFSALRRGIRLAVPGASGLHMFGGSLASSAVNYAGSRLPGTWVGVAPTPAATYVPINGALSGMDTTVVETAAVTILMVVRSPVMTIPNTITPYFITTYLGTGAVDGASIFGSSLWINTTVDGRWTWSVTRHDGAGTNSTVTSNLTGANIPSAGQWTLISVRANNTNQDIKDHTRNKTGPTTSALARNPTINAYRIGTKRNSFTNMGEVDVHSCLIYSSYLSDPDLTTAAAQLRALAAQKSISV